MTISAATASYPPDIRRSRFSWHFRTPGRRRWLLVQFISAPRDLDLDEEQEAPRHIAAHRVVSSQARLLDSYTGELWRRRSF
jgi:hypothetical protein